MRYCVANRTRVQFVVSLLTIASLVSLAQPVLPRYFSVDKLSADDAKHINREWKAMTEDQQRRVVALQKWHGQLVVVRPQHLPGVWSAQTG